MVTSKKKNPMTNPLGNDPKREKSGGSTFRKFNYQYHWALCRLLEEHAAGNDYALFVEEHEDVTLANSTDVTRALFEFNQVKETHKLHTVKSLTKIDKNQKNSFLGKLCVGVCNKSFSSRVKEINFVSTGGYSFNLNKKKFSLEVIKCGDLSWIELDEIIYCLNRELSGEWTPENFLGNLSFIIPNLPENGFDDVVEGRISKLINKITPGCKYNSGYIYDCVIRDLYRKGENVFDYKDWEQALKKKSITRDQFQNIIDQHINRKPDEIILNELTQILSNEYNLKSLKRRSIINAFCRYYTKRISERNQSLNNVSSEISKLICDLSMMCGDAKELEEKLREHSSDELKSFFSTDEELTGAFLYELITG